MREKSHELQWLEILFNRNGLTEKEIEHYQRLLRGFQGEVEFDKLFDLLFDKKVQFLNDITIRYKNNTAQLDKLFCINHTLFIVDMKYYRGHYVYEKDTWKAGQTILSHNIFEQLRRAVRIVEAILYEANIELVVEGVLVFMNPESTIEIIDKVKEKHFLYEDTPKWFLDLRRSMNRTTHTNWTKIIKNFSIASYKTKQTCSQEQFAKMTKGIMCCQCGDFQLKMKKTIFICSCCGQIEVKETAYVRSICEYGLLLHDKTISKRGVREFLGEEKPDGYLRRILRKHFIIENKTNKFSNYENEGISFEQWFKDKEDYFKSIENRKKWIQ